jgi:hAT family C-terminal dimerisation region
MNERTHLTFFDMAMDYLPIQASAVPSEHIFSSSAQTDTARRNRIKPILMEAMQMLKFGVLLFQIYVRTRAELSQV